MAAVTPNVRDPGRRRAAERRKLIGLAFTALPVTVFAVFAVAEGIGLEEGWWGHLLQLAVVVLLAAGAWVRPRLGGPVLILSGTTFTVMMLLADRDLAKVLSGVALVFAPLIVAGAMFTLAGNTTARSRSRR